MFWLRFCNLHHYFLFYTGICTNTKFCILWCHSFIKRRTEWNAPCIYSIILYTRVWFTMCCIAKCYKLLQFCYAILKVCIVIADVANSKCHQRPDEILIIFTRTIQEISKVVCKKTRVRNACIYNKLMLYETCALQQAYAAQTGLR